MKYVPYDKLQKKKKKEIDSRKRGTWYGINPVTRVPANPRAYNRNKQKRQNRLDSGAFC